MTTNFINIIIHILVINQNKFLIQIIGTESLSSFFTTNNISFLSIILILSLISIILSRSVKKNKENETILASKEYEIKLLRDNLAKKETQQKISDEEKDSLQNSLIELKETENKLFTIIAHQLKNPFNVVFENTDLLLNNFDKTTKNELLGYLKSIQDSTGIANQILENLLSWALSHSEKIQIHKTNLNLWEIANESAIPYLPGIKQKELHFSNKINKTLMAFADRNSIKTVFSNLISNATKYSQKGGNISINAKVEDSNILIEICDEGVGISQKNQSIIFDKNSNFSTLGTSDEIGAGLGMAISREFILKNGGEIWLESELGKGTKSCFTIPYTNRKAIRKDENSLRNSIKNINNLNILIVDDNAYSSIHLSKALRGLYSRIYHAKNGQESIDIFTQNSNINLILMDLKMPVMDGYYASLKIRELSKEVVIIAQTASVLPKTKIKAIESGCNDFITKPYTRTDLYEIVLKHFNSFSN